MFNATKPIFYSLIIALWHASLVMSSHIASHLSPPINAPLLSLSTSLPTSTLSDLAIGEHDQIHAHHQHFADINQDHLKAIDQNQSTPKFPISTISGLRWLFSTPLPTKQPAINSGCDLCQFTFTPSLLSSAVVFIPQNQNAPYPASIMPDAKPLTPINAYHTRAPPLV